MNPTIAIVGLECRVPGAASASEFWEGLRTGFDGIVRLAGSARSGVLMAVGPLVDVDRFMGGASSLSEREAASIDPQHLLFLDCASALLRPGYLEGRASLSGERVGVFASCAMNTFLAATGAANEVSLADLSGLQNTLHNDKDYLALRTAYMLDLTGPAIEVQTSCSSALVAVTAACDALAAGRCELAIAGGATLLVPQFRAFPLVEGSIFSPDGVCRAFDHRANGTVHGNGAAAVLLKRLDYAVRDHNPIFAVIVGAAINNDGRRKAGFTAPSPEGQRRVIEEALRARPSTSRRSA